MNKRIESITIETLNHLRHNVLSRSDMEDIQVPDVFIEKFAELMVKECAALIPAEQSHAPDGRLLLKIFEEHFGVAE